MNALKNERESRVNKILKQTTKEGDPYGYTTFEDGTQIIRITGLYEKLNEEDPKLNRFHRTRATELADILSSSEGITVGPSGDTGVSSNISQETKLRRIDEYLQLDYEELWENKVIAITDRAVLVTHRTENEFLVPDPEQVREEAVVNLEATNEVVVEKPRIKLTRPTKPSL